jgi:hypothetical protein
VRTLSPATGGDTQKPFYATQEPGALHNIPVQLGNLVQRVNLYVPPNSSLVTLKVAINYVAVKPFGKRFVYRCAVYMQCINHQRRLWPDLECTCVRIDDMKHALNTLSPTELNALCQRPGFNELYDIDCGGDPYGVFSMIHTEGLHALEVGIMDYLLEILFDKLSLKQNINWTAWSNVQYAYLQG